MRPLVDVVVDQARHHPTQRVDLAQAAVHEPARGPALPVDEVVVGLLAHRPYRRRRVGHDRPVAVVPDDAPEAVEEQEEAVRVVLQVEQHQLRGRLAGRVDLQAGQRRRQRARAERALGGGAGGVVVGHRHHLVAVDGIWKQAHHRHAVGAGGRRRRRRAQRAGRSRVLDIHAAGCVELHGDLCYKAVVGVQGRGRRHDARRGRLRLGGGEQGGQGTRGDDADAHGGNRTHDRESDPMA